MIFRPHSKENSITVSERELSCPPLKHLLLSFFGFLRDIRHRIVCRT